MVVEKQGVGSNMLSVSRFVLCLLALFCLSACVTTTSEDQGPRSPCVGVEGSPCDKQPVNTWRM